MKWREGNDKEVKEERWEQSERRQRTEPGGRRGSALFCDDSILNECMWVCICVRVTVCVYLPTAKDNFKASNSLQHINIMFLISSSSALCALYCPLLGSVFMFPRCCDPQFNILLIHINCNPLINPNPKGQFLPKIHDEAKTFQSIAGRSCSSVS